MKQSSNEAMKRGNEALNASSLQFLSSVKRFIATIFFSALIASLPLSFMEKHCLTLHRRYFLKEKNSSLNGSSPLFFKVTLPTSGAKVDFIKTTGDGNKE
jgi:hypothetical protein